MYTEQNPMNLNWGQSKDGKPTRGGSTSSNVDIGGSSPSFSTIPTHTNTTSPEINAPVTVPSDAVVDDFSSPALQDSLSSQHGTAETNSLEANAKIRKDLEDLQIRTIYSLLEQVPVSGNDELAKVLFLTNSQAKKLDLSNMDNFIGAMDISPKPKLVINFLQSYCYDAGLNVASEKVHWQNKASIPTRVDGGYHYGEIDGEEGLLKMDRKICIFLKEILLPVAIQTNAVVILNDDCCCLSRAFGELVAEEVKKNSGRPLPFTVINVGFALVYDTQSLVPGTMAYQLRTGSKRWLDSQRWIHDAVTNSMSKWRINHYKHVGPPAGCTHYIFADTVDRANNAVDFSGGRELAQNLTNAFARNLPSVGFVTLNHLASFATGIESISRYVGKGLPLVLLDTCDRLGGNTRTLDAARQQLETREAALNKAGMIDAYTECTLSYLHTVLKRIEEDERQEEKCGKGSELWKVIRAHFSQENKDLSWKDQSGSPSDWAKTNEQNAIDVLIALERNKAVIDAENRNAVEVANFEQMAKPTSYDELDAILLSECVRWSTNGNPASNAYTGRFSHLLSKGPFVSKALWTPSSDKKCKVPWCEILVCDRTSARTLDQAVEAWLAAVEEWKKADHGLYKSNAFRSKVYMACVEVLKNTNTMSCNLSDLKNLKSTVKRITKIDRLVETNSIEGLLLIQSSWDKVDIFNATAARNKANAKLAFVLLLLLGSAITLVTVVSINVELDAVEGAVPTWTEHTEILIVSLTLCSSVVAALAAYGNPGTKWQQLRGAALALESEIFKFRTRTGEYTIQGAQTSRQAEAKLQDCNSIMTQHVVKSATLMNTSFLSKFNSIIPMTSGGDFESGEGEEGCAEQLKGNSKYNHGQHPRAGVRGTFGSSNVRRGKGGGKVCTISQDNQDHPLLTRQPLCFAALRRPSQSHQPGQLHRA